MIKVINNQLNNAESNKLDGALFHYAHFICDCLYPEILNDIYKHEKVVRLKTIKQSIGNFKKIYEDVMGIPSIELSEEDFNSLEGDIFYLKRKNCYVKKEYMEKFRKYIFDRYDINPLNYIENYPEVVLIKRGDRIPLIDDEELLEMAKNIVSLTTGSERREIKGLEKIQTYLEKKYAEKFQSFYLEDKTFEEQVKIFNNAKLIIMAHGAAMSNMFFCKRKTTIVEVTCCKTWKFFDLISQTLKLNHIKIDTNKPENVIECLENIEM
jgi:hypothetical protein